MMWAITRYSAFKYILLTAVYEWKKNDLNKRHRLLLSYYVIFLA